jgi:hypothetical protein
MQIPSTLNEILKQLRLMMTNDGLKAFAGGARYSSVLHFKWFCMCALARKRQHTNTERERGHLKFYCALSLQILITFFFPSRPQRNKIMAPPPQAHSLSLPSKHTQSCYNNNNNYLLWQRSVRRLFKSDGAHAQEGEREKLHALQLFTAAYSASRFVLLRGRGEER